MTLNGVMAIILRYFTDFGSFRDALHKSGWRCRRKKFMFAISSPGEFLVKRRWVADVVTWLGETMLIITVHFCTVGLVRATLYLGTLSIWHEGFIQHGNVLFLSLFTFLTLIKLHLNDFTSMATVHTARTCQVVSFQPTNSSEFNLYRVMKIGTLYLVTSGTAKKRLDPVSFMAYIDSTFYLCRAVTWITASGWVITTNGDVGCGR